MRRGTRCTAPAAGTAAASTLRRALLPPAADTQPAGKHALLCVIFSASW